ncbi:MULTISPECIES: pyridine nucleotide transhydrogenase [Vibrio]|uniref:pyridine nucleotide transhydrogenase n=1 Tax=Vibrio TaxID=662 RepID=UPI00215D4790|nr:pyridine nucleotide transhydrogenase [Vibrio sp. RM-69-4]MCR9421163.1 pyridine nucleotide transhydrogenase [Vibrio sp. RM-69-4]
MSRGIIGYTGFVGGNLCEQMKFDHFYNSKNINDIRGMEFDELFISGVSAVKWLANKEPEKDLSNIDSLIANLREVKAKRVILISTVDVYPSPINVDESTLIDINECQPYGKHRLYFEGFVENNFSHVHILRLPGLFGNGLKKNIIFDFINKNMVDSIESRNFFQFYCLNTLSKDIELAKKNNIKLLNVSVEALSVKEVAECCGIPGFDNVINKPLVRYDFKSIYSKHWESGKLGYLYNKADCLSMLRDFVAGVDRNV